MPMIDLYFATSPNVYKIVIMLEEINASYRLIAVDVCSGMQHEPARIGGGSSGKVPVIVDTQPAQGGAPNSVFESGAILQYLAEKSGQLLPADALKRIETMQWLFWQMSGLGPFSGQCFHFRAVAPGLAPEVDHTYSRGRYEKIMAAHWRVMEERLAVTPYLADEYSIADIACYPWIRYLAPEQGREAFPNVARWLADISARPAIQRAYQRSREVDMGVPRNELDTTMYSIEQIRNVIIV